MAAGQWNAGLYKMMLDHPADSHLPLLAVVQCRDQMQTQAVLFFMPAAESSPSTELVRLEGTGKACLLLC